MSPFRYLLTFSKENTLKFIGHLDLQQLFEVAFRRSELPFAYSQGFKPHMLYSVAAPLPLGVESQVELLEIKLTEQIPLDFVKQQLNQFLPTAIRILKVSPIPEGTQKIMSRVNAVVYQIKLEPQCVALSQKTLEAFHQSAQWMVKRSKKGQISQFDLKPRIKTVQWLDAQQVEIQCLASNNGGVRLEEILSLLGNPRPYPQIKRTAIHLG